MGENRVYVLKRRVQFAETDMAGVVHFANYFRLMEEVEHAFWRQMGESVMTVVDQAEISWPRASVQCDYFAPARFEDELELRLSLSRLGTKSMTYHVTVHRGDTKLAEGRTTAVCCRQGKGEFSSVEIPARLRQKLEEYLEPGAVADA